MQKDILALVNDFSLWRGNSFTLATLVAEMVKDKAATVIEQDFPEASQIVRNI